MDYFLDIFFLGFGSGTIAQFLCEVANLFLLHFNILLHPVHMRPITFHIFFQKLSFFNFIQEMLEEKYFIIAELLEVLYFRVGDFSVLNQLYNVDNIFLVEAIVALLLVPFLFIFLKGKQLWQLGFFHIIC